MARAAWRVRYCLFLLLLPGCGVGSYYLPPVLPPVQPGIDVLVRRQFAPVAWKRAGLVTNPTGINALGKPTVDVLMEAREIELVALFGPEHGIRGDHDAGAQVASTIDEKTGVVVYSLYGETKKPTPEMLENIDVLFFDIQDIGVRPYTFIYTMAHCMEAAAEAGIPFVVLDRPNPLGGNLIDGNLLEEEFASFIGRYPIPYVHGMTIGELARMFNTEFEIFCQLHVIPMSGWKRWMTFYDTGLPWIATSPHIPHAQTAWYYAMTGFLGELDALSEGVGYTAPFEYLGAPWIDADALTARLRALNLEGVEFYPAHFSPFYRKYIGEACNGVRIRVIDHRIVRPFTVGVHMAFAVAEMYSPERLFGDGDLRMFHLATGTRRLEEALRSGRSAETFLSTYASDVENFRQQRLPYLLYQ